MFAKALRLLSPSLYIIVALFAFSGCSKQADQPTKLSAARHFDIPMPLTFKQTASPAQGTLLNTQILDYSGSLPTKKVVEFYTREMETNGWHVANLSTQQHGFIYCTKPHKTCGITIERPTTTTLIRLFIKSNEEQV
jgi:hypothetical protein